MPEAVSDLVVSLPDDPGLREAVEAATRNDGVELIEWNLDGDAPRSEIDIVVPPYWGGVKRLARIAEVTTQLVQWQSIGYNGIDRYLSEGVRLANAATVHEPSTAELAVGMVLAAQRGIPDFVRQAERSSWELRTYPSLADRRVLLVGYGGVAQAIEARLAGFEVQIERIARSARTERTASGAEVRVHDLGSLHERLADAEIVVLAVPLTPDTEGLIDADALAAMPDGALLVNVARGPVVDTDALVAELRSGRLRAALDVTDPEPLPADHPLWALPGVLITPHAGGDSSAMLPRMVALLRRQIAHLRAGENPENLVFGR